MSTTLGVSTPDQASYMLRAAAGEAGRAYKGRMLDLLDVRAGHAVLDVGCGPGTDLPALAERAGDTGTVIGVDRDEAMLARARARTAELRRVEVREGDAHQLPVDTASVDRAKIDRVLMHVADPAAVLAELHRVTRAGARVGLAEPDWDTLIVDSEDLETSRAFTQYTTGVAVRHATIGRRLARLAERAGFRVADVSATTPVFRDVTEADHTLGLGRNLHKAIDAGDIDAARGRDWFAGLSEGPFYASFTLISVVCTR
ncbi:MULTISPECIES: methyltransferase domain-containing protein [unclassified Streptomyces]|uniref:methyltransferase domain-containing protein n=1 Tax=unclassified Streptomyces TaxID=2593676 RepID=UPI000F718169|nr:MULTISPECIES: methyltransferase domain-containing protein [unclassified Streptomyces]AZM61505.1 16S rRNA (cytosine(1402)-N(4))-methyltransferase [Streptomyces sp. WAC 01438]RSM95518.1 16S rRNA (cytosine(1402)-N(4))-methyltransferase [Streptomyces sp. WAC 01420]